MASNLDYLDPALIPLEEKVNAYLEMEKALRRATDASKETTFDEPQSPVNSQVEPRISASSAGPKSGGSGQQTVQLQHDLARLEQEILALIPTRDEWVKVNLGYGPSRVGAWHVPAVGAAPARYELRIVH